MGETLLSPLPSVATPPPIGRKKLRALLQGEWTEEEDADLCRRWNDGWHPIAMAADLERPLTAVKSRLRRMVSLHRIASRQTKFVPLGGKQGAYSAEDIRVLWKMHNAGRSNLDCAAALGRSLSSIQQRLSYKRAAPDDGNRYKQKVTRHCAKCRKQIETTRFVFRCVSCQKNYAD